MSHPPTLEGWLATRPAKVQALAAEFPVEMPVELDGKVWVVMGYTEDDTLIMADPTLCYEHAKAKRRYLCAAHLRNGEIKVRSA